MSDRNQPSEAAQNAVKEKIDRQGVRATARELRLDRATLARVAAGEMVSARTLATIDKIAPRIRRAEEFAAIAAAVKAPPLRQTSFCWSLEAIRKARDLQMLGEFQVPVALAAAMRTDDALFIPRRNRIAAQSSIEARLVAAKGARGSTIQKAAKASVFVSREVLSGIQGTLADHGIAIGYVDRETNDEGTRVDMRLTEWPLEFVKWYTGINQRLVTQVYGGPPETINHGDGRWIVFRKFQDRPWTQDACVLPGALVWAAHANGISDWAQASRSHGMAKVVGELPTGLALVSADGTLEPEARAFLTMLQEMVSGDSGAGLRLSGSKTEFVSNGSTAWQVFSELISNREKVGARVYLGTDAILGSVGGAPGIDIAALFAIASTLIQTDLQAIQQGLRTGLYEPWTATNYGTSQYAPSLVYQLPDPDADAKAKERVARRTELLDTIERYNALGIMVDQDVVNKLARELGVEDPPQLKASEQVSAKLVLAPPTIEKFTTMNEGRVSQGLPPLPPTDPRGAMMINEFDAASAAKADATVKAAPEAPAPATP